MKNANPHSRMPAALFALLAGLALFGCSRGAPAAAEAPRRTVADWFPIRLGGQLVRLQLAVLPGEMEHGLMGRRDLAADQGMLFVYPAPIRLEFWMRNTPTPLEIGYFTPEGVLAEIYPMLPFDETTIASRSSQLQFALEMNQGWYEDHGVGPGARLDLAGLKAALRARGFDPQAFGLNR